MNISYRSFNKEYKTYEVFGFTEEERLKWRVDQERFEEILNDEQTKIHTIQESSTNYGEFLFVTVSRAREKGRICMTFFSLGYHEYRERWFTDDWFWYQANPYPKTVRQKIKKDEAEELIMRRREVITPDVETDTQTERGKLFELVADLTDEDGALAELEDLEAVGYFDGEETEIVPPTGDNLLDDESREKLPDLYNGEEQGLDAVAQVKFFTPSSNWTWYTSEFD